MFNILHRAWLQMNLTPGERALLRFGETLLVGAILAGLQAVLPSLSAQPVNWSSVLHTFLAAFVMALYLGVSKYLKAHGDGPLPVQPQEPDGPTGA